MLGKKSQCEFEENVYSWKPKSHWTGTYESNVKLEQDVCDWRRDWSRKPTVVSERAQQRPLQSGRGEVQNLETQTPTTLRLDTVILPSITVRL